MFNLMDMLRNVTNANAFAAPGTKGNLGDMMQGIGHDMMQHYRYGQGTTPAWAQKPMQPQTLPGQPPITAPTVAMPPAAKPMAPQVLPGLSAAPPVPLAALPSLLQLGRGGVW